MRRHLSGGDPLGQRIVVMPPDSLEVVGVVGDVRQQTAAAEPKPQVYVPHAQLGWPSMQLVVRTRTEPAALVPSIRQAWEAAAPGRPMAEVRTAAGIVSDSLAGPRFSALLVTLFAALALLLAAIGIYGVVAFGMTPRTSEIGVRMALGARPRDVLALVLREGAAMAAAGLAAGILMAVVLARFLAALLYGIGTTDPLTFGAVAAVFLAVVLAPVWMPARRAMRDDPAVALREQ